MSWPVFVDVTDLLEFYGRRESASGVQRVIEGVTPPLLASGWVPVALDRTRGALTPVDAGRLELLLSLNDDRPTRAQVAGELLVDLRAQNALAVDRASTVVFPGAVWISDAMMLAASHVRQQGARLVFLLYDLTPVMEAGHTAAVNMLFDRYLHLVARTASRVPAISQSSRRDFDNWCENRALAPPPGEATRLPNGLNPRELPPSDATPWPRPFALMVGTIESRKNHRLALRAWEELIDRHGADTVPDLVCVGRFGWHVDDFLRDFYAGDGAHGKVHLLTSNVTDRLLADLYRHCQFTVYPSRYEGWGLPVSESLTFGKVPIVADNSSLREAGGDLAVYFQTDDVADFVSRVESAGLDERSRHHLEESIAAADLSHATWRDVAQHLISEVAAAQQDERNPMSEVDIDLDREYMFAPVPAAPDGAHADQYVDYLIDNTRTPLLDQVRGPADFSVTDRLLTGQFGVPQPWGLEIHPDRQIRLAFQRPVDGALSVLIATRSMPGRVRASLVSPDHDRIEDVYLGSALRIDMGEGAAGEAAVAYLTVIDASDSVEGFLGVRSLVVSRSGDHELEKSVLRASARALRQELDFLTGTRSWRLTAPLRKRWGRSPG